MTRNRALAFVVAWTVAVALLVIAVVLALSGGRSGHGAQVGESAVREQGHAELAWQPARGAPPPSAVYSLRRTSLAHDGGVGAAQSGRIAHPIIGGVASYVRASLGPRYLAMRLPRGTRVRICGAGCVTRTVNDYGPSARIRPLRIADLSAVDFLRVCGPLSMGVCRVRAVILDGLPEPPATDTDG